MQSFARKCGAVIRNTNGRRILQFPYDQTESIRLTPDLSSSISLSQEYQKKTDNIYHSLSHLILAEGNVAYTNKEVEHIYWSNSYSVGIKLIDDQHKGLLDFVNDLLNHSTGNEKDERAYFAKAIGEAVNYVKVHFATEEKIMLATNFQDYPEHKKAHEDFILAVVKNVKDFEDGKRLVLLNFSNFLKNWILSHIAIMDVKYSIFLKELVASKKAEKERTAIAP
jgi:hemerythrin